MLTTLRSKVNKSITNCLGTLQKLAVQSQEIGSVVYGDEPVASHHGPSGLSAASE